MMHPPLDYEPNYAAREEREKRISTAIAYGLAFLTVAGLVWLFFWATEARAHEAPTGWTYPWSCCSNQDCRPTGKGEVRETSSGYRLVTTGEIVPYSDARVKDSPDGLFHACQVAGDFKKGRILCLFVPPRSF
jgi:uncharacterized iron-regulated membrane protein